MSDKPALRPDLAVGEALRAVAHDILSVRAQRFLTRGVPMPWRCTIFGAR